MACSIRVKPGNLRSRPSPSVRGGPARRHGNLPRRRCTRRSGGANLLNCNVVCHIPIETNSAAAAQRETTMWSKARDLSTLRRVIHSFCGQTTPRWAYSRDMEPSPLSIQSKTPGSGVGRNPSQPLCNLRPCASRRTSHTPRSRTPIAPPIISAGQSVTANIDQNPPARHNHRRATPEEKHTKIALCGFSAGLTMKCEPSHHVVWHNMHRKTAIFQRPETTPPMPAYHTSPKTTEKRIVWQTERAIRAGRPSALVTIMFYGSTPAICRTSASALNNPSPVCVAMCAPERRPCAHRDANRGICVLMFARLSFRRALKDATRGVTGV